MARVHYLRQPAKLPAENDIPGMAAYWKKYYNIRSGNEPLQDAARAWEASAKTSRRAPPD